MDDHILAAEKPAFARSVKAIVTGDVQALRQELAADPVLVQARSVSAHRATLLHYVAANGIEPELQRQVPMPTRLQTYSCLRAPKSTLCAKHTTAGSDVRKSTCYKVIRTSEAGH
jgi:hypothetical protein